MTQVNSRVESFKAKVEKAQIFQKILSNHDENYFKSDDISITDIISSLDFKPQKNYNLKTIFIPAFNDYTLALSTKELSLLFKIGCDKYLLDYSYNKTEYPNSEKFIFLYDGNVYVSHVSFNQEVGILFCVSSHLI